MKFSLRTILASFTILSALISLVATRYRPVFLELALFLMLLCGAFGLYWLIARPRDKSLPKAFRSALYGGLGAAFGSLSWFFIFVVVGYVLLDIELIVVRYFGPMAYKHAALFSLPVLVFMGCLCGLQLARTDNCKRESSEAIMNSSRPVD